jgi:hypothetical protein
MKINKFFALALVASALMASCRKGDAGSNELQETARLNIRISVPENTRGAASTAPTDAVSNFTVFVTNQSDVIQWDGHSGTNQPLEVQVTTAAKHVYVVANAGDLRTVIGKSKAALDSYIANLNGSETGASGVAGKQTSSRWSTGDAVVSNFSQNGGVFEATANVPLTFIAARITLKITTSGEMATSYNADSGSDGSLKLTDVVVLNARGESKLFGTSLIPTSYSANRKYFEGLADDTSVNGGEGFFYYPATADHTVVSTEGFLKDAITATNATELASQTYYYYVFQNDATDADQFPTIITIRGTYDGKPIYFPVHLASYEQFTGTLDHNPVLRGKSYNITVNLKGNPLIAGGEGLGETGGTDDPTEPIVNANVEVTVVPATWTPVTLGKEF